MKVTTPEKPLKPGEEQINSGNCCGQCLYNVPQGTFMLFLPGLMCLVIGIVLFFTDSGDTWRNGMIKADMIFISLGTVLLGGGIIYYSITWCRIRKRKPPEYGDEAPSMVSSSTVQLVGVYRITAPEDQFQDLSQAGRNPNETVT